jgi:hypothetical protein
MHTAIYFTVITEENFKQDLVTSKMFSSVWHASQHQSMSTSGNLFVNFGKAELKFNSLTVFSYALKALATDSHTTLPHFMAYGRHMARTLA